MMKQSTVTLRIKEWTKGYKERHSSPPTKDQLEWVELLYILYGDEWHNHSSEGYHYYLTKVLGLSDYEDGPEETPEQVLAKGLGML